ncbi:MAG: hypothetical protein ABSF64_40050, partial [Bryobacteraceae bacterium]
VHTNLLDMVDKGMQSGKIKGAGPISVSIVWQEEARLADASALSRNDPGLLSKTDPREASACKEAAAKPPSGRLPCGLHYDEISLPLMSESIQAAMGTQGNVCGGTEVRPAGAGRAR